MPMLLHGCHDIDLLQSTAAAAILGPIFLCGPTLFDGKMHRLVCKKPVYKKSGLN
jgi:hypothetical protein